MRRIKYNNKKKGRFKSILEHTVWKSLPHRNKRLKIEYETEKLDYVVRRRYNPDIIVVKDNGHKFYIEIKGYFRAEDRTKMIAVKAFNPDADIRLLFASDNPLYKGSSSRNSDWAKKNGFQYAIGVAPKEWFN